MNEDDIKYFAYAWIGHKYTLDDYILQEVKILYQEYDEENKSYYWRCSVLQDYLHGVNNGRNVIVDNEWQLFDSLREAQRILIAATLNNDKDYFYGDKR